MGSIHGRCRGGAPEQAEPGMSVNPPQPSWRKPAGTGLILLLILVWAGLVAAMAGTVGRWPVLIQAPFYLFMGIAWIAPLKPLIRWMETGFWTARRTEPLVGPAPSPGQDSD